MMSIEAVKSFLAQKGMLDRVLEFETSSATVELAAQAAGVIPARIAKTLTFYSGQDGSAILVVTAGDAKVDNAKFKARFGLKAKMLSPEDVVRMVGHAVGGVCPFIVPTHNQIFLDISLKRFESVFPACGSSNSAIELTCEELFELGQAVDWVDVCKNWA